MFFEGFGLRQVSVPGGALRVRVGGSGPPLLLLHGNPQTHAMWHRVAPELARTHTVVCADLRGYGGSFKPAVSEDHAAYSKRAMAGDMLALMDVLGFDTFAVAAHDRGARVAHRMALDAPGRVERLAVLDIVPTVEQFERADMAFALGYYHWFWFAQPHPKPESVINAAPDEWFAAHTSRDRPGEVALPGFFASEALADYLAAAHDPRAIAGMCEDYRAAASIDLVHDRASRLEGERVRCPMLVLWGAKGRIGGWYDPLALWREYCAGEVRGGAVQSGHYLAEEAPEEVMGWLGAFLAGGERAALKAQGSKAFFF